MLSPANCELLDSILGVTRFTAKVTTGDRRGDGTDAAIWLQLVDAAGEVSEKTLLDKTFERGDTKSYNVVHKGLYKPDEITCITIWREITGYVEDSWYLNIILLEDTKKKKTYIFPVHRWIREGNKYYFYEFDAYLPQHDRQQDCRKMELECKRKAYLYKETVKNGPLQVKELPEDENFSDIYLLNIQNDQKNLLADPNCQKLMTTDKWQSLEEMSRIFSEDSILSIPHCISYWKEDRWFGLQRVQGMNPVLIALCKEIPEKLAVQASDLELFLEELTLDEALQKNRIFIVDLEVLNGVPCQQIVPRLVSPIALFFLNTKNELMPIAIQLFHEPSPTNPVFFPNDPPYTWLLAKMFFNMGEAQVHQSCTHMGLTHMLIESMCVAANRNLSPSHPIFRLMAPHFLYLLPANVSGIHELIETNGFFDRSMTMGRAGALELIGRTFEQWRLDEDGNVERELAKRGVLDPEILPYYPYRDDGLPLYKLIRQYVTRIVKYFYDTEEDLTEDYEVQGWVKEMATMQSEGGCGIRGIPEKLTSVEQLVDICTAVISISSMGHAAANFQQYQAYALLTNYPIMLTKCPPETKKEITELELMEYIPVKKATLSSMVLTKVLSTRSTKYLGEFEVQYLYNPEVVATIHEFRLELLKLSLDTKIRNLEREYKYEYLDPDRVLNSISI